MPLCAKCGGYVPPPEDLKRTHKELCARCFLDTPEGRKEIADVPDQHLGHQKRQRKIKLKPQNKPPNSDDSSLSY